MTFTMLITINYFRVDAGGSPAASHFSCFAKKSKQKKATRGSSPRKNAGYPSETAASVSGSAGASQWDAKPLPHLETTGRCGTRARNYVSRKVSIVLALKQSSRTSLSLLRYSATLIGSRVAPHHWLVGVGRSPI